jgi:hypothetical protein
MRVYVVICSLITNDGCDVGSGIGCDVGFDVGSGTGSEDGAFTQLKQKQEKH